MDSFIAVFGTVFDSPYDSIGRQRKKQKKNGPFEFVVLHYSRIPPNTLKGTGEEQVQGLVMEGEGVQTPNSLVWRTGTRWGLRGNEPAVPLCHGVGKTQYVAALSSTVTGGGGGVAWEGWKKKKTTSAFFSRPTITSFPTTPVGARRRPHCAPCGLPSCEPHSSASGSAGWLFRRPRRRGAR